MTHPNIALIQQFYDAFARGDMETLAHLFTEDFLFIPGGKRNPIAGPLRGATEILAFMKKQSDLTGGTWIPHPHDFLASDNHVAVLVTVNPTRHGRTVCFRLVHLWTISKGRATTMHSYVDDQYLYDEFFS